MIGIYHCPICKKILISHPNILMNFCKNHFSEIKFLGIINDYSYSNKLIIYYEEDPDLYEEILLRIL